jgi:NAD-dependent dihydropyrimidine dehydrogenase PreA subunit
VPNVTDWQYLNLNYVTKAKIDQDLCIKCGRCYAACEDTSHQAIMKEKDGKRHFEVMDDECVACNLCVEVCPVDNCITMVRQTRESIRAPARPSPEACQLDHASQQSDGAEGGGVRGPNLSDLTGSDCPLKKVSPAQAGPGPSCLRGQLARSTTGPAIPLEPTKPWPGLHRADRRQGAGAYDRIPDTGAYR